MLVAETPTRGPTAILVTSAGGRSAFAGAAFTVEVEFLDDDADPWRGAHPPGSPRGCRVRPWPDNRGVTIRSDRAGLFVAANLDLLLRSQKIRSLSLDGEFPPAFVATLDAFAEARQYATVHPVMATGEPARLPEAPPPVLSLAERIQPGRAALVLIDVQNDFCAPKGATGRLNRSMSMIDGAVASIKNLLAAARRAGLFVVHVRAEYGPLYRAAGSPYRFPVQGGREPAVWTGSAADIGSGQFVASETVEVCLPGTWGSEFVEGIVPRDDEAVLTKHRFDAFADTGLEPLLRGRGIDSIIVAGVTTNCCVETTARDAVMRDFNLVVASDCVAVKDHLKDLHDATLESLGLYFGLVRPSGDLIRVWQRQDAHEHAS